MRAKFDKVLKYFNAGIVIMWIKCYSTKELKAILFLLHIFVHIRPKPPFVKQRRGSTFRET